MEYRRNKLKWFEELRYRHFESIRLKVRQMTKLCFCEYLNLGRLIIRTDALTECATAAGGQRLHGRIRISSRKARKAKLDRCQLVVKVRFEKDGEIQSFDV